MRFPIFFLVLVLSFQIFAQQKNESALIDSLSYSNHCLGCIPVVYAEEKDNNPFMFTFTGEIIAVTPAAVPCDAICNAGTIAVRITSKTVEHPFKYDHDTVYVSLPCFYVQPEDYLHKIVSMTVFKLQNFNDDCFQNITNKIDSHGVPFYYTNILKEDLIEINAVISVQKAGFNDMKAKVLKTTFCDKFDKLALEQARWKFKGTNFKDSTYKITLLVKKDEITPDCSGFRRFPQKISNSSPIEVRSILISRTNMPKDFDYYTPIIDDYLKIFYVDTAAIFKSANIDYVKIVHKPKDRWNHIILYLKPGVKSELQTITENIVGGKLGLFINGKFISYSEVRGPVRGGAIQFELHYPEMVDFIKKNIHGVRLEGDIK